MKEATESPELSTAINVKDPVMTNNKPSKQIILVEKAKGGNI